MVKMLPSLNGFRFVSILLVICGHLAIQYDLFAPVKHIVFLQPFLRVLTNAQMGVNIFFVISGFLITTLLLKEEETSGTISWKHFYIRRILRIFPAYFFLLFVYFGLTQMGIIKLSGNSWATSLTYSKYLNWNLDWYTAHFWSLSMEEQFYLLWPFIFLTKTATRKKITLWIIVLVPAFRIIEFYSQYSWMGDFSPFQRMDAIAIGCLVAFYRNTFAILLLRHQRLWWWIAMTVIFLLHYLPEIANSFNGWFLIVPTGTDHGTIANICIAILLLHSLEVRQGPWFYFLNMKWISRIGVYSYGIYLWQQFFLYHTPHIYNQLPWNLLFLTGTVAVSWIAVERPFLKLKERFGRNGK